MSGKKKPRAWAKAAPSNVTHIPGFTCHEGMVKDFAVFVRQRALNEVMMRDNGIRAPIPMKDMSVAPKVLSSAKWYQRWTAPYTCSTEQLLKAQCLGTEIPEGLAEKVTWTTSDGLALDCIREKGLKYCKWVSFDAEFTGGEDVDMRWSGHRRVASWQFGFVRGSAYVELLVLPRTERPLSTRNVTFILSRFLKSRKLLYKNYDSQRDAPSTQVMLISHYGVVDWSTLEGGPKALSTMVNRGHQVFSATRPFTEYAPANKKGSSFYKMSFYARDSGSFTDDESSLAQMGSAIGLEKLHMSSDDYADMTRVREEEPLRFAEYAMRDVEIVSRYMDQLPILKLDTKFPTTSSSCGANFFRNKVMKALGLDKESFDSEFRGMMRIEGDLVKDSRSSAPRLTRLPERVDYVSESVRRISEDACRAYHGGYNASIVIGYYDEESIDVDVTSAYPAATSCIRDIDFGHPIEREYHNEDLTPDNFPYGPTDVGFGYVSFEFPKNVYAPCIPIKTTTVSDETHGLVFVRSSEDRDGVYVTLQEVYLALKLGAKIHAFHFNVVRTKPGMYTHRDVFKGLIAKRSEMKDRYGKTSLQQKAIKIINNSVYGKIAQNVSPKKRRSNRTLEMEDSGESAITNPCYAATCTAITRAVLIAAVNELHALGYTVYSVTTDGFITNAPIDIVSDLELYGYRDVLKGTIQTLKDDDTATIFEVKHTNTNGLLNLTTRFNIGLNMASDDEHPETEGVFATAGWKTGKTLNDRYDTARRMADRKGPVRFEQLQWASLADMLLHDEDFHTFRLHRSANPNFDLKRKPIESTLRDVTMTLDDTTHTVANFDTEPYETYEEYIEYRSWLKKGMALTESEDFRELARNASEGARGVKEYTRRDKVRFAVTSHRCGLSRIPKLDELRGMDRTQFIEGFMDEGDRCTPDNWKNWGRAERANSLPDRSVYESVLREMGGKFTT